jgi:hypothetical protein
VVLAENVEHLVWAEMGGINGIWRTVTSLRNNMPLWTGEAVHNGLSIHQIIEKTWKPKEQVPESAKPRWGGPVEYWIAALRNCKPLLESLAEQLESFDLEKVIYPDPISGPLHVIQCIEFLSFHTPTIRSVRVITRVSLLPGLKRITTLNAVNYNLKT